MGRVGEQTAIYFITEKKKKQLFVHLEWNNNVSEREKIKRSIINKTYGSKKRGLQGGWV